MKGIHDESCGICPNCGEAAVYNGNYFCNDQTTCKWTLPGKVGDVLAAWAVDAYRTLMTGRNEEPLAHVLDPDYWKDRTP